MSFNEVDCPTCEGTGRVIAAKIPPSVRENSNPVTEPCHTCLGTKTINQGMFQCNDCKGEGKKFLEKDGELQYSCPDCEGKGQISSQNSR